MKKKIKDSGTRDRKYENKNQCLTEREGNEKGGKKVA
jgi:hypothetical protein